jgi:hypothetical protein
MRLLAALALCCVACAFDPSTYASFAVAPRATAGGDSLAQAVFATVGRIGARHGLQTVDPRGADNQNDEGWQQCFTRPSLFLCGKVKDREVQFELRQVLTPRFSPDADSLRRELLDSLRAQFGADRVRECKWQVERDQRRSGCAPRTPG